MRATLSVLALTLILLVAGCGSKTNPHADALPQGGETVKIDPADFTTKIDNVYWPMKAGDRWVYSEGANRVEVTVTGNTKRILGVDTLVVHDLVTNKGARVEDTYDWYAQDKSDNVWYFGEDTKEFKGGKVVSTEGSWLGGVDGAQPGVVMPAKPVVGLVYRQEYYKGQAEDSATILSVDEKVEVPFGSFDHVLLTKDYTPLDPSLLEHKFYSRGVGLVLAIGISGGSDREELVRFMR